MKKLYILKTGTTFPDTLKQLGDFDAWTRAALGETATEIRILDVEQAGELVDAGVNIDVLLQAVSPTPAAENLLRKFADIVDEQSSRL